MDDKRIAYLQMIQEPICRTSTTSAVFKGFAATIVAGISALAYSDVNVFVLILSFLPVCLFLCLDLYYLKIERRFRYLYEQVRTNEKDVDFSMSINVSDKKAQARVIDCVKSPSIWLFYPIMIAILVVVVILKLKGVI